MTLLSRKADYALLILSYLHQRPDGGTARAIAEQFGLSRPFVANILKELCQNGFVASHRGVKGGYALARAGGHDHASPSCSRSIEDGFRLTVCNHAADARPRRLLARRRLHDEGADGGGSPPAASDVLRGVTLAELFDPTAQPTQPCRTARCRCWLHARPRGR